MATNKPPGPRPAADSPTRASSGSSTRRPGSGILTSLVAHPKGLLFNDLKDLCSLTDGNLSRHLQVLHEAGLVEVWKGYQKNRPQTLCRLTDEGRRRFLEYINVLENVVADALRREAEAPGPPGRALARLSRDGRAERARARAER